MTPPGVTPPGVTAYRTIRREMESRRAEAIAKAEQFGRRMTTLVWAIALLWYAVGIGLILVSYHVPRLTMGNVAFWAGVSFCFGGPFFVWVVAYTIGRDHGMWG